MHPQAWHVITWERIEMTLEQWEEVSERLMHTSTSFRVDQHSPRATSTGQVLWTADLGSQKVGVAWDWAELSNRYIVLLDPMYFVCNVSVVDAHGHALAEEDKLVLLNDCIHSLPWQDRLMEAKRRLREVEHA